METQESVAGTYENANVYVPTEKEEDDAEDEIDQFFAQAGEEGELDLVNDMKQAIKTDYVN